MDAILKKILEEFQMRNIEDGECFMTRDIVWELNVSGSDIYLLRSTEDCKLTLKAVMDQRLGIVTTDTVDQAAVKSTIQSLVEACESSTKDPSYTIASCNKAEFIEDDTERNEALMYESLKGYLSTLKEKYPLVHQEPCIFKHKFQEKFYVNTKGSDLHSVTGVYEFLAAMNGTDGKNTSSMAVSSFITKDLHKPLIEQGNLAYVVEGVNKHMHPQKINDTFKGSLLTTPMALHGLLYSLMENCFSDHAFISDSSPLKDKLGETVFSPKLTLLSHPNHDLLTDKSLITADGHVAEEVTFIDKGTITSFRLSLFASKKTGLPHCKNDGEHMIVQPGNKELNTIIKETKRGIILGRFSGGMPSNNGDFSGVAKNSYYVEDGEIKYPISEAMISGNILDLLRNIRDISSEQVNFGARLLPWVCSEGITISG